MWKGVKDYEWIYQVSDEGQIRRIIGGKTRPVKSRENGKYCTVSLSKNGVKKTFAVHRLVAEAFLEKPEGKCEVNHKDGDKHNNRVDNLEWVSQTENRLHAMNELKHFPFGKPARKIRCIDPQTNEEIRTFHSVSDAAKSLGKMSARSSITLVCQGYQNTAYGYKWQYVE